MLKIIAWVTECWDKLGQGQKKGDGGFKSLQKEIGGIQILVEIFQKNFLIAFLGVKSYILDEKNQEKKFQIFFIFHRGDPYDFFQNLMVIFKK